MAETNEFPLPPADFSLLVESMMMQAQMQLGLFSFGDKGEAADEPNLPMARHTIDLLAMLQEKTRGNLTQEEQRLIENGLTELRFRFVQVTDNKAPKAADETPRIVTPDGPRIITPDGGKGTKSA